MSTPSSDPKIARLSPLVRFMLEFHTHATLLPAIYDEKFAERLAVRTERYQDESRRQIVTVAKLDALLLFLTVTKGVTIPFLGLNLSALSYATEAVFLLTAILAVFAVLSFISWQGHVAMIGQWCKIKDSIDPEYLQAAYSNQELFLRVFRADLNLQSVRPDLLQPEKGFRRANRLVTHGLTFVFLVLFLVHVGILSIAGFNIWQAQRLGNWGTGMFLGGCAIAHLYAIGVFVLMSTPFKFRPAILPPPIPPAIPRKTP